MHAPLELFVRFLIGSLLAVIGMMLLFVGIDLGIVPMGRFIGAELPTKRSILLILVVAFSIGVIKLDLNRQRGLACDARAS